MRNIVAVAQRELGAYFLSPIAYAVIALFLFISGLAFGLGTFTPEGESSLQTLCNPWMVIILVLILPLLTMRLMSEELRGGTIETLMTAPVTDVQVVLGKYLGAFMLYLILLATLLLYPILLSRYGDLDVRLLLCNYLGLILMGSAFIAVGLFFSTWTRHEAISALLSLTTLALITFASDGLAQKLTGWPRVILQQSSVRSHFVDFVRGLVTLNHLVFFVTVSGLFLFLTVKLLETRRWQ